MGMFDHLNSVEAVVSAQQQIINNYYGIANKELSRTEKTLNYVEGKLGTFHAKVNAGALDIEDSEVIGKYDELTEELRCVAATLSDLKIEAKNYEQVVHLDASKRIKAIEDQLFANWSANLDQFIVNNLEAAWVVAPRKLGFEDNFIDQK